MIGQHWLARGTGEALNAGLKRSKKKLGDLTTVPRHEILEAKWTSSDFSEKRLHSRTFASVSQRQDSSTPTGTFPCLPELYNMAHF